MQRITTTILSVLLLAGCNQTTPSEESIDASFMTGLATELGQALSTSVTHDGDTSELDISPFENLMASNDELYTVLIREAPMENERLQLQQEFETAQRRDSTGVMRTGYHMLLDQLIRHEMSFSGVSVDSVFGVHRPDSTSAAILMCGYRITDGKQQAFGVMLTVQVPDQSYKIAMVRPCPEPAECLKYIQPNL